MKKMKSNPDERFQFGPLGLYHTKKEIARVYKKRREFILSGHCVRCMKELRKKDKLVCWNCGEDLKTFCFEADLKNKNEEIKEYIQNISYVKYKI